MTHMMQKIQEIKWVPPSPLMWSDWWWIIDVDSLTILTLKLKRT